MDIHEHQAKAILRDKGVPVPEGHAASTVDAARAAATGAGPWVVKAQVHAGGRGAAGGVKLCRTPGEVAAFADRLIGTRLVTRQTDATGKPVEAVYVEHATDIAHEMYLAIVTDRAAERAMVVASYDGGMEIEDIAEADPARLHRFHIDPALGLHDWQVRELAFALGLKGAQVGQLGTVVRGAVAAFRDHDATMLEVNPLAVTAAGDLVACDAKMSFDTNALFRQPAIAACRDRAQEDAREAAAGDHGLSYVGLTGDIGCIINGAGLAMATMDMIHLAGGEPANFLDIGGGASPERVVRAFRTVLADGNVSVILVNIFAGINRCDWVAEGVVAAYREVGLSLPVVVRLAGTNVAEGRAILRASGLPIITAGTLAEAAEAAVAARPKIAA